MRTLPLALAALACTSALAATSGTAVAAPAARDTVRDPAGDVRTPGNPTAAQRATVDLIKVRSTTADRFLVITATLDDISKVPGNPFLDTEVRDDGGSFTLTSGYRDKRVRVFTGSTNAVCKGSKVSQRGDVVEQVIPLDCLGDVDRPTLVTAAVLAKNNGTRIAIDKAKPITLPVTS